MPPSPQTAELSPDAPPDNKTESLISSLNRASSGTAGSGTGLGGGSPTELAGGVSATTAPTKAAAPTLSCPHGYGNPPRQTESPYSAPCALAFHGDNGGATGKNVDASEIRVGFWHVLGMPAERGLVPFTAQPGESPQLRTYRVLQQYWNSRYEFFGRVVHLDAAKDDPTDDPTARAAAVYQDEVQHDFAVVHLSDSFCDEFSRRDLVCFDGTATYDKVMEDRAPGWWTLQMSHDQNEKITAEYACKKLVGANADFAGPVLKGQPRKIGVIIQSTAVTGFRTSAPIVDEIKAQCGYDVPVAIDLPDNDNSQALATATLRMQQQNITTIILWSDISPVIGVMQSAEGSGYFPEWVMINSNGVDFNTSAKTLPAGESKYMFGMSGWEMPRPFADTDCYKAYKAIDPANTPDQTACNLLYPSLEHVLNGIQLAGSHLTPKTFEQGLFKYGHPAPLHDWEIGGGFGPHDRSWVDTLAEIWWDGTATDPQTGNPGGAYRYTDNGHRYGIGQIPRELKVFNPADPTGTQ